MKILSLTELESAYLAGMMELAHWGMQLLTKPGRYHGRIILSRCSCAEVLFWLGSLFEGNTAKVITTRVDKIPANRFTDQAKNHKDYIYPSFVLRNKKNIIALIQKIEPFLVLKAPHCRLMKEFYETVPDYPSPGFPEPTPDYIIELRGKLYKELCQLNKSST